MFHIAIPLDLAGNFRETTTGSVIDAKRSSKRKVSTQDRLSRISDTTRESSSESMKRLISVLEIDFCNTLVCTKSTNPFL